SKRSGTDMVFGSAGTYLFKNGANTIYSYSSGNGHIWSNSSGQMAKLIAGNFILSSNETIDASAKMDISSSTKGILIPRMTTTNRDAIGSPAEGLLLYNNSTHAFNYHNGTSWTALGTGSGGS